MAEDKTPSSESNSSSGSSEKLPRDLKTGGGPTSKRPGDKGPGPRRQLAPAGWVLGLMMALVLLLIIQQVAGDQAEISFSTFYDQVQAGNVSNVRVEGRRVYGEFKNPPLVSEVTAADKAAGTEATEETDAPPSTEKPGEKSDDEKSTSIEKVTDAKETDAKETDANKEGDAEKEAAEPRLPAKFFTIIPGGFDGDLRKDLTSQGVRVQAVEPVDWSGLLTMIWFGLLVAMAIFMFSFFRRTRDQMMGGGMLGGVTKSPAKLYAAEDAPKVTFDDVAGLKGAKADLKEIVDFLKEPEKFQRLGARVPKGVLLNGPPGTGKTLLAKAVAGEAGTPFYSINGSEFIQMFVGVGASRVRDMFKTAKKNAPAILFIDEIDAVGRQRGAGLGGGHDEREQTLNQILSEMDGFTPSETVIIIAATNRPDVLDPALLRPGRFDRHITVDRPSLEGRKQLFEVHSKKVPVGEDVDFETLARATVGMTGADIQNLVNEAALWATRTDRNFVTMEDFEYARDKALMGSAREDILTEEERKITAYHEAGHALVAWRSTEGDRVHKVTIIPRGRALGVTQLTQDEDRHNMSQAQMHANLAMALAGRTAEKLVFDEYSAGAESDLERATKLARRMVTHWGMSERLGPVAYHSGGDDPFLGREITQDHRQYSEHTAQIIDDEVAKILHAAADRARRILSDGRADLEQITNALLEKEEIDENEIIEMIGEPARNAKRRSAMSNGVIAPTPPAKRDANN